MFYMNFHKNFDDAVRHLQIADHMAYVTFPLINEKRLMIKIFDETYKSVINSMNAILKYEIGRSNVKFNEFSKIARKYGLFDEQIKKLRDIIVIQKKRKESSMEFIKKDKLVIMSDNLSIEVLDLVIIKKYILVAKELLVKTKDNLAF